MSEDQAQALNGAKAPSSSFNGAVDSSRAARLAALEVARQMRVQAREQMRQARSARKRAALQNEALEKFVRNCQELGIDMSGVEVPTKSASQSFERTSDGNPDAQAHAGAQASAA